MNQKINSAEELARLIKTTKIIVIKFSASWCGPCKNKNFLEMYNLLKNNYKSTKNIKFIELDVDTDSEIIDDKKYFDIKIDSVPTFLISKDGSFTKKYSGVNYIEDINKYLYDSTQTSNANINK